MTEHPTDHVHNAEMRMAHFRSRIGIAELAPGTAAPRLAASVQSFDDGRCQDFAVLDVVQPQHVAAGTDDGE